MRRGKATANAAFGNAASVLVGDFIYTRAFQMMTSLGSLKVLEVMSEAVNVIAEGEVLQLMNVNDPDITEENYMRVIYSKTARLFEAAAQCSGILAGCTPEEEKGLQDYGRYLGTAFQLIDDLLDYNADGEQLGKNVGDDLNEGKPTLPLLHAMHHGTPEQAQMIRTAIEQGNGRHLLEPVLEAMNACGSLEWTRQRAVGRHIMWFGRQIGVQHLPRPAHRNQGARGLASSQGPVIPAGSTPQTIALRVHCQSRGDDQIGLLQRFGR